MASSIKRNYIKLYLRPNEYQNRTTIRKVASWLVFKKNFTNLKDAIYFLLNLQENDPERFNLIIANFHKYNDYVTNYKLDRVNDPAYVDEYRTSKSNLYGEPWMYHI